MKKSSGNRNMPQTEQVKRPLPGQDLSEVTSKARCTEYDLERVPSRTRMFVCDEQTFAVPKRGNKVTESGNY